MEAERGAAQQGHVDAIFLAVGSSFRVAQPIIGLSVATSLIDGEAKPKHVLLLEIKGNQYRPTKIPLRSVRPFEYAEVVLKDEADVDPNDQASVLEHLDKTVRNLIEKSNQPTTSRSELRLPLIRIKVDYSGFSTINPQRFGQKYVGKILRGFSDNQELSVESIWLVGWLKKPYERGLEANRPCYPWL